MQEQGLHRRADGGEREGRKKYKGAELTGRGTEAVEQQGFYSRQMRKRGQGQFGQYFDYREQGGIGQQVQAALAAPENIKKFTTAVEGLTNAAKKGSKTWEDIALRRPGRGARDGREVPGVPDADGSGGPGPAEDGGRADRDVGGQRLAQNRQAARGARPDADRRPVPAGRREEAIRAEQGTRTRRMHQVVARATADRASTSCHTRGRSRTSSGPRSTPRRTTSGPGCRAQRNFGTQIDRLREDAAKQMYNPYERIMTQPAWDTQNLMGNMKEQTEAMEKQSQQLAALRKKGVSQQTIDTLELYKPENAQQLDYMTSDLKQDPKLVERLNQQAASRG